MCQKIFFSALFLVVLSIPHCSKPVVKEVKPVHDKTSIFFPDPDLRIELIQPGVYLVTHSFPWPANSLLVNLEEKGFCLVDTPYTPETTEKLLAWMKRKFQKLPVLAINTGFHVDNLGGNGALSRAGVPVYGMALTNELVRTRGARSLKGLLPLLDGKENDRYRKAFEALSLKGPEKHIIFDSEGRGRLLAGAIDAFYPGPTHTDDNFVVFFPSKNILFGGCMVLSAGAESPGNTTDANMKKWPWNVEKVLLRYAGTRRVVPGHGSPGDVALLRHTIDVLHRHRRGR